MGSQGRKVQIRGSLGPGQALEFGRLEIRWLPGMATVQYGSAARVVVLAMPDGRAKFLVETDGSVLPILRHEAGPQPQDTGRTDAPEGGRVDGPAPEPPVLRLGPGGDCVRDWYPEDLAGKPR
ncbi:MAG TPA: hypothetical protein VMY35_03760 [Phycisphaerae bacterium]|nr:hypothetical protein [Phycisphaerae bacterium]